MILKIFFFLCISHILSSNDQQEEKWQEKFKFPTVLPAPKSLATLPYLCQGIWLHPGLFSLKLPNDKLATDGLGLRDSYRIAKRVRRLHLGGWLEFRVTIYIFLIWVEFLTSLNSSLDTETIYLH